MTKEYLYTFRIRFENGAEIVKKVPVSEDLLPFMVMKLRSQYRLAEIDWSGTNGKSGTTRLASQQQTTTKNT